MISAAVYNGSDVTIYDDLDAARTASGITWVQATDSSGNEFQSVAETFDIHPLAIEDVRQNIRPKAEQYATYTFVLLKTATLTKGDTVPIPLATAERIHIEKD